MNNKNVNLRALISSTAMALALASAGAAHAQDTESAESEAENSTARMSTVTVTAQFKEQSLQDTPIAITALNSEMLDSKGASNLVDAANLAPNVQMSSDVANFGGTAAVFIRGTGQSDPYPALEPGVGMYIDDIYYGVLAGSMLDLVDTDRIEILRGPQGTLTGKNSIGGAIKIFSKRPGPEADAFVEAGYGSRNSSIIRGATNLTLVDDQLYARISAGAKRSDGYVDQLDYACATGDYSGGVTGRQNIGCKIGEQGGKEVFSGRLSLLWTPNDRIENLLIADSTQDRSQNPAIKTLYQSPSWAGGVNYITGPEDYTNYENYIAQPKGGAYVGSSYNIPANTPVDAWGVSNNLVVEINDNMTFTSITGFRSSTTKLATVIDGTPISILDQLWTLDHEQFTQELRLGGVVGDFLDYTLGAYYYDADGLSTVRVNLAGGILPGGGGVNVDLLTYDPAKTTSKSVFAHTVWHLSEDLDVTLAGRYTEDTKDYTFNRLNPDGTPHPTLGTLVGVTIPFEGDRFDYRAAVNYDWSSQLMTYAQVSTGYKGGGVNPRPFIITQALPFDPEELISYEAGLKSQFADGRVTLNSAVFYNEYSDFQAFLTTCPAFSPSPTFPCSLTTNVGDATIKGAEVEIYMEPVDNLLIDLSAGYLDFEYDRLEPASGITADKKNPYTPEWTGAAGIQYTYKIGDKGSLTPRLDMTYRSSIETDTNNYPGSAVDNQTILSGKLSWENAEQDWRVQLSVTNLTDEFYYNSKFVRPVPPYFAGIGAVAPPRTFMVTVKRTFD